MLTETASTISAWRMILSARAIVRGLSKPHTLRAYSIAKSRVITESTEKSVAVFAMWNSGSVKPWGIACSTK